MSPPDRPRLPRPAAAAVAAVAAATFIAAGLALLAASPGTAQISIPLGGPPKVRPSPNAALLGAPADIVAAVAVRGRSAAMRHLDDVQHPVEVLEFLGLTRGVRAFVVEHDPGYYGAIIAGAVGPGGRVTELVAPAAMRDPATRAALSDDVGLAPGLSLLTASPATRLAPADFDFVVLDRADGALLATAAAGPPASLQRLFAAVRPGGIVGVVDAAPGDADGAPAGRDAASIKRDFARAGFVLDNEGRVRGGDDQPDPGTAVARRFILKFRKPE